MKKRNIIALACLVTFSLILVMGFQQAPSEDEKIPFLTTFSKKADKNWGDDDFVQIFFFVVPVTEKRPLYINVFDPEIGGANDEAHADFNSKTKFTVYGGKGAHSNPDSRGQDPVGKYNAGVQLATHTFDKTSTYDNKWFSIGPLNPVDGELQPDMGGYVFKIIIEGLDGDDGNLYKLFLSSDKNENKKIDGGNSFSYEYSFRLSDKKGSVSHLYPFITTNVLKVKVNVFDFDDDGEIRIVSVANKGEMMKSSADGVWFENIHSVVEKEHNTSLDIQFVKHKDTKNNNIVVNIKNQYNEAMPFYTTPIGGVPKYFKPGAKKIGGTQK